MLISILKASCLLIYALALASWAGSLHEGFFSTLQNLAVVMLGIHLLELAFVWRHLRRYPGSLTTSVLLTLLFGLLHWKPLANQARIKANE